MFQALKHRNFRLLWVGLLISFSGSYMQTAAILWHVSLLVPDDRRPIALGMVGLVRVVPIVVFSLISGVAADALDRRKLMLRDAVHHGRARDDSVPGDVSRTVGDVADLRAGRQ